MVQAPQSRSAEAHLHLDGTVLLSRGRWCKAVTEAGPSWRHWSVGKKREAMNAAETRTRANFLWLLCRWRRLGFPSGVAEQTGLGIGLTVSGCGTGRKNVDAAALRGRAGQLCLAFASGTW